MEFGKDGTFTYDEVDAYANKRVVKGTYKVSGDTILTSTPLSSEPDDAPGPTFSFDESGQLLLEFETGGPVCFVRSR